MTYTYRDILASELLARKRSNAKFSLRAFARDLGLSPGHLSALIGGKKDLSRQQASMLISKLELSPNDKAIFLSSAFPDILQQEPDKERSNRILREDEFNLISEWQHFAILSLGEISGSRAQSDWIAERLGITALQARDALNRLKRLGLITIHKDGSFKQSGKPLTTSDDIPSRALKSYHKQNLDLAKSKLDVIPVMQREFGAVTMAINPSKLGKAKKMIRDFQDRICEELEVGKKKVVYTFSVQLFPVCHEKDSK